ncbi:MAG: hypothetical protein QGF94_05710, partial [Candidatus Thalassarchaeaceae archaeon]|nr:hypothetical protein [Candidatus Thalassarchaeaceae archaeon]
RSDAAAGVVNSLNGVNPKCKAFTISEWTRDGGLPTVLRAGDEWWRKVHRNYPWPERVNCNVPAVTPRVVNDEPVPAPPPQPPPEPAPEPPPQPPAPAPAPAPVPVPVPVPVPERVREPEPEPEPEPAPTPEPEPEPAPEVPAEVVLQPATDVSPAVFLRPIGFYPKSAPCKPIFPSDWTVNECIVGENLRLENSFYESMVVLEKWIRWGRGDVTQTRTASSLRESVID